MEKKSPIAVEVVYCTHCTMPSEYCEYSSNKKCNPKFIPEPAAPKEGEEAEAPREPREGEEAVPEEGKAAPVPVAVAKPSKAAAEKAPQVKIVYEEKKHRAHSEISGLHTVGANTKDLAKKLSKKFGTGCGSVTDESVVLQGVFKENLIEFLVKELPQLSVNSIVVENKIKKKPKPAPGKGKPGAKGEEEDDEDEEEEEPKDGKEGKRK